MGFSGTEDKILKKQEQFIKQGYTENPHVYACITFIAKSLSQIPFQVYEVVDEKSYQKAIQYKHQNNIEGFNDLMIKAIEETQVQGLSELLKMPNEHQAFPEFLYEAVGFKYLTGNNYVYGLTNRLDQSKVWERIYNMPSQLVEIEQGTWRQPVKGYTITIDEEEQLIDPDQVMHRKFWNPNHDEHGTSLYGMSPLMALGKVIARSNESKKASLAMMTNGVPAGILSNESGMSMTREDNMKLQKQMDQRYGGGENAKRIMIGSFPMKWQQIGLNSVDLELIAADKADLRDVCRVLGVPVVLLDDEASSFNNVSNFEKTFWRNTGVPELDDFVSHFNRVITKGYSSRDNKQYLVTYQKDAIPSLQKDRDAISERALKEFDRGIWSGNEVRAMLDKEAGTEQHLDKYYISNSLASVNPEDNNDANT